MDDLLVLNLSEGGQPFEEGDGSGAGIVLTEWRPPRLERIAVRAERLKEGSHRVFLEAQPFSHPSCRSIGPQAGLQAVQRLVQFRPQMPDGVE
ncbi:hypothetical protein DDW44_23450 [Streptomyces tirandamycinicus]|uniref:Uncharacterized protein n=1 Tax=Streptomyces tirandamycinicus TaxID=2174846 RepID=A0A2S1SYU1_9ACTN|nr:hypothetical protein DDW44_23450 [Streptomyces tirandamycinicus]